MGDGATAFRAFEGNANDDFGANVCAERRRKTSRRLGVGTIRRSSRRRDKRLDAQPENRRATRDSADRKTPLLFILNETRLLTRREGGIFLNLSLVFVFRRNFPRILTLFPIYRVKSRRVDAFCKDGAGNIGCNVSVGFVDIGENNGFTFVSSV